MKTILVENSTWNNIGDGFYQSALYVYLKELFPDYNVLMGDGPIKRAFRPTKIFEANTFKLMDHEIADIHVFSGPMLPTFIEEYGDKVREIVKSGRNYALVSCSLAGKTHLVKEIGAFFKEYPPIAFSSRDPDTFHQFEKYLESSYNGICGAFLVNKLPLSTVEHPPFFISSFYSMPEPLFSSSESSVKNVADVELKFRKAFIPHKFDRHFEFLRFHSPELNNLSIVRPVHAVTDRFSHINFGSPNSFLSFNPLAYLSLYKAAEFTISDRIHACAVSIALGKPARLFTNSPRAGIFDRLGIDYKSNGGFIEPCPELIEKETKLMGEYLLSRF
ncbi:MAG: hypothetical protein ACI88H_001808 [Cocleimonas sp.]